MPTNPNPDIPGMIFSREGKAAAIRDTYHKIVEEVESLAQLMGGTEPDDDLCDAIAFLARAMGSLTNARRVALQEWAADGGDACYTEAELDKLLGELGKIAREEPAAAAVIPDFETVMVEKYEPESGGSDLTARVYKRLGYDRVDPLANGSADALEEKP